LTDEKVRCKAVYVLIRDALNQIHDIEDHRSDLHSALTEVPIDIAFVQSTENEMQEHREMAKLFILKALNKLDGSSHGESQVTALLEKIYENYR
jgi:hypothetical protein